MRDTNGTDSRRKRKKIFENISIYHIQWLVLPIDLPPYDNFYLIIIYFLKNRTDNRNAWRMSLISISDQFSHRRSCASAQFSLVSVCFCMCMLMPSQASIITMNSIDSSQNYNNWFWHRHSMSAKQVHFIYVYENTKCAARPHQKSLAREILIGQWKCWDANETKMKRRENKHK